MFGQRKRREAAAEAAREDERRALFARLAERPENICPFLGLAGERTGYVDGVSDEHRCYAFGDPAPLSAEQQTRVCQERGYGNCPRYLRGVLVIPTEELEALRRARPEPAKAAPSERRPAPVARRRRRGPPVIAIVLALLLLGGAGVGAWLLLGQGNGVAVATPTPTPSVSPTPTPAEGSPSPTAVPTDAPSPTPIVVPSAGETIPPLPTPNPDDDFTGYAVFVIAGEFPVTRLDDDDQVTGTATAIFSRVSAAPVDRIETDGEVYWKTLVGVYTDLAYSTPDSGDFAIYETYETPDGDARFSRIPDEER